jgi:hypothetical protein
MKTIEENDKGELVYSKGMDGIEVWYEYGLCIRVKYPSGYDVRYEYDKNTRTVIRVTDNEGLCEAFPSGINFR